MKLKLSSLFVSSLLLTAIPVMAQQVAAFPGAQGFGVKTSGGRGGKVMYVTNLNASGPGSLNEALSTPGKRYILFKVSGVINAAAEVIYGNFTLAGQTSPGGITVRGFVADEVYDTVGTADNMIIRFLRSRPHDVNVFPSPNYVLDDACRLDGASNVIIDHCSFANAVDENVQISQSMNVTIQNCIIAEGIGGHYDLSGMLINYSEADHPQDSLSINANIWVRIGGRLPEFSCESPYCATRPLHVELNNNIFLDPGINTYYNSSIIQGATADQFFLHINAIKNLVIARANHSFGMFPANLLDFTQNKLYFNGNIMNIYPAYADYDLFYCCNDFNQPGNNPNTNAGVAVKLSVEHPFPNFTPVDANKLPATLSKFTGVQPHDAMDRRLLAPLTTQVIDPKAVNGTDYYQDAFTLDPSKAAPMDNDNDGMPDYWELQFNLNPAVQDHNGLQLSPIVYGVNGLTNLEVYLGCLAYAKSLGSSTMGMPCKIDLDNTSSLPSEIVSGALSIAPNPVDKLLRITNFGEVLNIVQLSIIDLSGRVISTKAFTRWNAAEELSMNTEKLAAGNYILEVQVEGKIPLHLQFTR